MSILVQKFGGTSLRDINNQSKLLKHIRKSIEEGNDLVVVVSAMGRKGEPYATDTLIQVMEKICEDIDPKKKDLIMSCGEVISTAIVSHLLDTEGIPSEPLMGFQAGILTDNNFNDSKILDIDIKRIKKYLEDGKVVVVAGFQGATIDMEITTLGRGGSDTTAVALGGFLGADRVDIFTDVPGVAMIDPRIVPYAKYIKNISYNDMYNLSSSGATVIHPRAALAGKHFNIPIRVLSTFLDGDYTLISNTESDGKIVGIAIEAQDEKSSVSIIYNKAYKEEIIKDMMGFIIEDEKNILKIIYSEEKISFIVKNDYVETFGQRLYDYFIN